MSLEGTSIWMSLFSFPTEVVRSSECIWCNNGIDASVQLCLKEGQGLWVKMLYWKIDWTTIEVLSAETFRQNWFTILPSKNLSSYSPALSQTLCSPPSLTVSSHSFSSIFRRQISSSNLWITHHTQGQMNLDLKHQVTIRPLVIFKKAAADVWLFNLGFCWQLGWTHLILEIQVTETRMPHLC